MRKRLVCLSTNNVKTILNDVYVQLRKLLGAIVPGGVAKTVKN